ncbi:hypothetical protein GCM10023200_00620 [Actinomycetospora chlora]|uniref:PST family polysaccharide transporter n=1 Tax=Actinomycetospora chlora TaxID=663608 RepID=A0ABP9A2A4_9PSEU
MSQPPRPPDPEGAPAPAGPVGLDAETTHLDATPGAPGAPGDAGRPDDDRRSEVPDSEHDPSLEGLGSRLRSGAKFASVALVFTQLLSLGQTIVVARILTPTEIGVFTLGTIFANFLTTLTDGGMRAALIQRGREIEDAANTVFWVGLVTGTLMSLGALAASPLLTLYFDDRMVGLVCAATSGTLLVHSLLNVPEALMQRTFNFKRRLIVDPTTAATFALVTVTLALLGLGVWGMVIGFWASQLATLIACWTLSKWRPGKGRFVFRIWREMAGYAGPLIVSSVVDQAREAVQSALVGGRLDIAAAGQYRYGRRIAILPGQAIIQVASYVLFPAFARIAVDMARFRDGLLRSLRMLWVATTPFAAVLVALGEPIIVVLLGREWQPAGVFVAAMAGFGPGVAMAAIGMESIKGAGASKLINWLTVLSIVVGIGGLILLLPFGLFGVGIAASLDSLVGGVVAILLARRLAGVSLRDLAGVLIPPLIAAVVAGGAVWYLEHTYVHADERGILLGIVLLAGEGLLLLGIFGGLLFVMAPEALRELRDGLLRRRGGGGGDTGSDGDEGDEDADGAVRPTDPRPDDLPAFLDAPTEVLPIFGLAGPTEQVWSPYRPSFAAAPRPPLPPRRVTPALPPRPTPSRPSTPVATDDRARRFEEAGLDAPTTAIRPVRNAEGAKDAPAPSGAAKDAPAPAPARDAEGAKDAPAPSAAARAPLAPRRTVTATVRPAARPAPEEPDAEDAPATETMATAPGTRTDDAGDDTDDEAADTQTLATQPEEPGEPEGADDAGEDDAADGSDDTATSTIATTAGDADEDEDEDAAGDGDADRAVTETLRTRPRPGPRPRPGAGQATTETISTSRPAPTRPNGNGNGNGRKAPGRSGSSKLVPLEARGSESGDADGPEHSG